MDITFRPVTRADLPELNRIINDPEVSRYLTIIPPVGLGDTKKHFNEIQMAKNVWTAILIGGKIAGSYEIRRLPGNNSHVATFGINIDKPCWGCGVGREAMQNAAEQAKKEGLKKLELEVVKENARALHLYRKMGFKKEGCKTKHTSVAGDYKDALIMGKWLG